MSPHFKRMAVETLVDAALFSAGLVLVGLLWVVERRRP